MYIFDQLKECIDRLYYLSEHGGEPVTPLMIIRAIFFNTYIGDALQVVPVILIAALVYWFIRRAWHKRRLGDSFKDTRKKCRLNEIIRLLLVCWITGIVAFVIMPDGFWSSIWYAVFYGWKFYGDLWPFYNYAASLQINFFMDLKDMLSGSSDKHSLMLLGNIALFVPLGLALPLVWKRAGFFPWMLLTGFGCSLVVELIQPLCGRLFDVDDLICNTLGVIFGYLLYLLIKLIFPKFVEKCRTKVEINSGKPI